MHLGVIALVASPPPPAQGARDSEVTDALEVELLWEPEPEVSPAPPTAARLESSGARTASAGSGALRTRGAHQELSGPQPADQQAGDEAQTQTPEPSADVDEQSSEPRLTLQDLGVGNSEAHWDAPGSSGGLGAVAARKHKRRRQLEARIEQEMAQKALERDVRRGIGPGGPALTAFEAATRVSAAPARGYAVFQLTTDASGRVMSLSLVEADGGTRRWSQVGQEVLRRLGKQRLRVAGTPTRLLLRIESTESLPSGADPGFGVEAFGLPLKRGEGKKSAKLSVLAPPKLIEVDVPDPGNPKKTIRMPMFVPPNLLSLGGDLADVGAKPRRVVYARVLRADALAPPRRVKPPPQMD